MPITYALFENNLTGDPDDYAAQVQLAGSAGIDGIVHRMPGQGSTVPEADVRAVLADTLKASSGRLF
jgi:hypothetical protein